MSGDSTADAMDGEDELSRLRRLLAECETGRASDKEEFESKMKAIREKTKDHMTKFQERTQAAMQQKDAQLQEAEAAKDEALAEVASSKAQQSAASGAIEDVAKSQAKVHLLEKELETLRQQRREQEEKSLTLSSGSDEAESLRSDLQQARSLRDAARAEVDAVKKELADLQAEHETLRSGTQTKIGEVVAKAKEHVKQMQSKLDAQISENQQLSTKLEAADSEKKELSQKFREVDDAYAQQQEKLNKYKQLMAQANARIEDGDEGTKEIKESYAKLQQKHARLKQQLESVESACIPPPQDEIDKMGGILLAVEAENDDVWCLLSNGGGNAVADNTPTSTSRRRWWLSSQLDVLDMPIPLQRRWKGEVSALRAQTARAKKGGDTVREEFEAYKQKANAALQNGAANSGELLAQQRKYEQLGEQLQSTHLELERVKADKASIFEDLGEARRKLTEAAAQKTELEQTFMHQVAEARQGKEAAVAECRAALELEKESLSQKWREKERRYIQDLDLQRARKESLEEEIENLRSRLNSRPTPVSLEPAAESDSEDARVPSSAQSHDGDAAVAASPSASGVAASRLAASPLDDGIWRGTHQSPGVSPRPSPRSEGHPSQSSSAPAPSTTAAGAPNGAAALRASDDNASGQALPPQAYTLHASVAWQDLVSLRAQVRQLEAALQDQKAQNAALEKTKSLLDKDMREVKEKEQLKNVSGQHQQMEYIRNVFRKFVENAPAGQAESEQLIPVLMTFFQFAPEESRSIQAARQQASQSKGFFSAWRS